MKFQEVFRELNGRDAKPDDVLRFERLTATLETTPGDALLSVLVALDHYETLYASIPEKIEEATNVAAKNAETQAAASVNKATAKLVADASKTIQRAVIVREWRNILIALAASIVVAAGTLVGFGIYTHHAAYSAGYKAGYADAEKKFADQKISANWSNTETGQMAYKMYRKERLMDAYELYKTGYLEEAHAIYRNGDMKWAYQLSQAGSLEELAKCNAGDHLWIKKKTEDGRMACFPEAMCAGDDCECHQPNGYYLQAAR